MFQDEAGFGRISKIGSCWSPKSIRPTVASHYIREFRYCFGAVSPQDGAHFFIIAGACNTAWTEKFLEELSEHYPDDYILLVMDNAVWHKSKELKIPHNIELMFIPPYTPEMNPIEQIWYEIRKQGFINRIFSSLDQVIRQLEKTIQNLSKETVKSITRRDWIMT